LGVIDVMTVKIAAAVSIGGSWGATKSQVCIETHTSQGQAGTIKLGLKLFMAQPAQAQVPKPAARKGREGRGGFCSSSAFTLIELLLVVAIIAILAALLLPALGAAQAKGKRVACLGNLKQSALSFQMYTADNDGKLAQNYPLQQADASTWVLGNMKVSSDSTNQTLIRQGKFYPYASQVTQYRCPSDPSRTGEVPRVRSYSMNGWIGSRYMEAYPPTNGFRTFVRDSEVSAVGPARIWAIVDEHEASIDDAWFLVTMDDSRPFASFPTARHDGSYGLNFADGHAEFYKLHDPASLTAEGRVSAKDPDWQRLKQVTTIR
jgi:prepilin-type N-terminal cleavage/methylation domain-containing protein